jgi:hypothetical protein
MVFPVSLKLFFQFCKHGLLWGSLQVEDWFAPPRVTYPGSQEFKDVYGSNVQLGSPMLVFKLQAEEDEIMVSNDD